jgi:hypothetical protein
MDRQRLAFLGTLDGKVQHLHGLVERFAIESSDQLVPAVRRAFVQLKLQLMGAGYDAMAQLCGGLDMAARRGGSRTMKVRILREGVGSLRLQVELEQRAIRSEAEQRAEKDVERNGDATPPPPGAP